LRRCLSEAWRINPSTLDPASPLAVLLRAALARDDADRDRASVGADSHPIEHWCSEEDLQRAIIGMIAVVAVPDVVTFHVPNGGKRPKVEACKLKGMGTLTGVPDLIVLVGGRAHLCIGIVDCLSDQMFCPRRGAHLPDRCVWAERSLPGRAETGACGARASGTAAAR
jgi:hypothetical protein